MMVATAPTIPQARAVLAHYAEPQDIHIHKCRRNRYAVTCTGTQAMCVYHGPKCVPVKPIRYRFRLSWQGSRIVVSTHFDMEI